ncbi:hemerythrin domain-containing protein [Rubrivivax sp. A210]|uniref:hemerythrin domain-containing protein n=1 Tax=Rubrivivax sp. A210 TaxID=2772301 RepID=UPI00191A8DA0|nr:hemerythrin domain-containing protein [Rubrivivax sp. A210]
MKPTALDIIREEHQALAAMLRSLVLLLAQARRESRLPDFNVLRAMLFYVDEFPEALHHPKESELLFPRLRERCPELAPVMARLDDDHRKGEREVRALQHALLAFELLGEPRRAAFERAAEGYVAAYLEHMAIEEREILPAARRVLGADDCQALDTAFAANRDPLTGHAAEAEFAPLFQRILLAAPAPIGLGPPG